MTRNYQALNILLMSVIALSLFAAANTLAQEMANRLTEVEGKKVCMITNQLFIKDQIAVEVEGKTYYGCCEMCKAKLNNVPEHRIAVDPISGNQVDKSEAVIGAAPDGSIYYFESEENLKKYSPIM